MRSRTRPHANRRGWSAPEIVVVLIIIVVLSSIAAFAFLRYHARTNERLCHTQQRTLDGLIYSSTLDVNVSSSELFAQLIRSGQIGGVIEGETVVSVQLHDPGHGNRSWDHYGLTPSPGNMVFCIEHGSPFFEPE